MVKKRSGRGSSPVSQDANRARRQVDRGRYSAALSAAKRAAAEDSPYPTVTEITVLHARVLARHDYAVEALIERLLPVLTHLVRRSFPATSDDLVLNAVEDALLDYVKRPDQFDRSRGVPLLAFLRLASLRNLSNSVRAESRRMARQQRYIEEAMACWKPSWRHGASGEQDDVSMDVQDRLAHLVTSEEQPAMALWLQGERRTGPLAMALGIAHLSVAEQRRQLKRIKDRLRNRLKRLVRRG